MVKQDNHFENNPIKIGESAEDNDKIISDAKQTDTWFHLASFPSCHVVISCSKEYPLTKQMIYYCASLVKENTKYKNMPNLKVNYTTIKHVKKTDTPGKVSLSGKVMNIVV